MTDARTGITEASTKPEASAGPACHGQPGTSTADRNTTFYAGNRPDSPPCQGGLMYTLVSHRNHTGRMCGDPPPRKVAMTPSGVGKVWARFFGDGHRSA